MWRLIINCHIHCELWTRSLLRVLRASVGHYITCYTVMQTVLAGFQGTWCVSLWHMQILLLPQPKTGCFCIISTNRAKTCITSLFILAEKLSVPQKKQQRNREVATKILLREGIWEIWRLKFPQLPITTQGLKFFCANYTQVSQWFLMCKNVTPFPKKLSCFLAACRNNSSIVLCFGSPSMSLSPGG